VSDWVNIGWVNHDDHVHFFVNNITTTSKNKQRKKHLLGAGVVKCSSRAMHLVVSGGPAGKHNSESVKNPSPPTKLAK
jgi:hypothetical protein